MFLCGIRICNCVSVASAILSEGDELCSGCVRLFNNIGKCYLHIHIQHLGYCIQDSNWLFVHCRPACDTVYSFQKHE